MMWCRPFVGDGTAPSSRHVVCMMGSRHGTAAVLNRLVRRAVGVDRAAGHRVEAGAGGAVGDRGPGLLRPARGRERAALPEPDGLSVAAPAARPSGLVGGVLLLHP